MSAADKTAAQRNKRKDVIGQSECNYNHFPSSQQPCSTLDTTMPKPKNGAADLPRDAATGSASARKQPFRGTRSHAQLAVSPVKCSFLGCSDGLTMRVLRCAARTRRGASAANVPRKVAVVGWHCQAKVRLRFTLTLRQGTAPCRSANTPRQPEFSCPSSRGDTALTHTTGTWRQTCQGTCATHSCHSSLRLE